MARKGILPLSTAMARAFTNGSSTTSHRPTPKKNNQSKNNGYKARGQKNDAAASPRSCEAGGVFRVGHKENWRMLPRAVAVVNS